jgi:hypothetical protein
LSTAGESFWFQKKTGATLPEFGKIMLTISAEKMMIFC